METERSGVKPNSNVTVDVTVTLVDNVGPVSVFLLGVNPKTVRILVRLAESSIGTENSLLLGGLVVVNKTLRLGKLFSLGLAFVSLLSVGTVSGLLLGFSLGALLLLSFLSLLSLGLLLVLGNVTLLLVSFFFNILIMGKQRDSVLEKSIQYTVS